MARPRKQQNDRKQPVTISLHPTDLVILDNLAKHTKRSRSAVISEMLVAKGFKDLGLSATSQHTAARQEWPTRFQAQQRGIKYDPDSPKACNPAHIDGKCNHESCRIVYRKYGVA